MTRSNIRTLAVSLAIGLAAPAALADDVPLWQKALKWISGSTSETAVPTMTMDRHMQMSLKSPRRPGDAARAERIVAEARIALEQYADVATAERDGYRAFAPTGRIGEEVHYTSVKYGGVENDHPDWSQPGSLLYRRTPQGMKIVGVMMTAPNRAGPADLDARAPLSIATWHRHVNFCGEPRNTPKSELAAPRARFGFEGSIDSEAECGAAGGYWIPVAFGWMTHVYPNEAGAGVWGGETMHPAAHAH